MLMLIEILIEFELKFNLKATYQPAGIQTKFTHDIKMTSHSKILNSAYQVRSANIASEEFDGEMVVLDLDSGCYFSLNTTAAKLWSPITSGYSLTTLQNCVSGLDEFIESLLEFNLIIPADPITGAFELIELDRLSTPPLMEVFDDLSDLFMADPIHDVDTNKGWPHTTQEN